MVQLPTGFTAISSMIASDRDRINFMAVILHVKQPYTTKTGDWCLEMRCQDDMELPVGSASASITLRTWRKQRDHLPEPKSYGDLVVVRCAKVAYFNNSLIATSNAEWRTETITVEAKDVPAPECATGFKLGGDGRLRVSRSAYAEPLTQDEQWALIELKAAAAPLKRQIQQFAASRGAKVPKPPRMCLIQDVGVNCFHDIRCQVVKIYAKDSFGADLMTADIYVSDYTSNKDLFLYADPEDDDYDDYGSNQSSNWAGPYGQLSLPVRLYGGNSLWARNQLKVGDFVFLRNVRIKLSQMNKIEGALHEDRQNPSQIDIRRLVDQGAIDEINHRKNEYESQRAARNLARHAPKKPSAKAASKRKEERRESEKMQKMQRELEQEEREQAQKDAASKEHLKRTRKIQKELEQQELEEKADQQALAQAGLNIHVRASYPAIQASTISEILANGQRGDLPFVNAKYKARVRIVDYFPPNLEDWCHHTADQSWNKSIEQTAAQGGNWQWAFVLLVQDATAPISTKAASPWMRVVVSGHDAVGLLQLDPCDLKLAGTEKLEDRMFILWGNLLERKRGQGQEVLQNLPFECNLVEYGSRKEDGCYQQNFKLFSTTIMSD